MKKKLDVMTVVSIVLIVLVWLGVFINFTNTGSCEFDDFTVLPTSFKQLFAGVVYASNTLPQFDKVSSLDGIIRSYNGTYTDDSICMVFHFNCLSDNKVYSLEYQTKTF